MGFELIEKQVIYNGRQLRLEVHHLQDPEQDKRIQREVIVHSGAVVILPVLDASTILLIRNRRYAVGQYLLELPAGTIEPREPPMNAAGRELLEETGYLAQRIKPLISFFSSPGISTEKMHAFAAYDLKKSTQALEPGEDIELLHVSFEDALGMIRDGQIQDAKTSTTLLAYDRFFRGTSSATNPGGATKTGGASSAGQQQ